MFCASGEKLQQRRPKPLHEQLFRHRRQRDEAAIGAKRPVGGEHMHVRVKVHQVAEGMHEQHQPRPGTGRRGGVGLGKQPRRDAAQLSEPGALARKDRPQNSGQGEHVLAVRDRGENVFLDPFAVGQHAFLVATGAEVPGLAGKSEQVVVPAGLAADASKAVVRVAALDKALDRLFLDRTANAPGFAQLRRVSDHALVQRARPRIPRSVDPAFRNRFASDRRPPLAHARGNAPGALPALLQVA
jgi:hypothetical protein